MIRSKVAPDAVVVTELKAAQETYLAAVERFGADRVLVPSMLGVETSKDWRGARMTIDIDRGLVCGAHASARRSQGRCSTLIARASPVICRAT